MTFLSNPTPTKVLICLVFGLQIVSSSCLYGQNYATIADGNWNLASSWAGPNWAAPTPATSGGYGMLNISHDIVLNGPVALGSISLNIHSGGSLTINGDLSGGGEINLNGGNLTVRGNFSRPGGGHATVGNNSVLTINGGVNLAARLQTNRGGTTIIDGDVTVNSSNYLIVAQTGNANPTEYADLVIKGNLFSEGSGDVTINKNGRVAVYGDVTSTNGGGTIFTVNQDGQVYVHGDMSFTGGGDAIRNNNTTTPYGLYVNGTVTNTGGGANTTINRGSQQVMFDTNEPFTEWVASLPDSPIDILPITLLSFAVTEITPEYIELGWTTGSESNNSHFVLLRSSDAKVWEEIGRVEGSVSSQTQRHYSFRDYSPAQGVLYYSLKQVDIDGAFEMFAPILANTKEGTFNISIFPNPTSDYLTINLQNTQGEVVIARLYDLRGNLITTETSQAGSMIWDLTGLEKALYLLKISSQTGTERTYKLVKK